MLAKGKKIPRTVYIIRHGMRQDYMDSEWSATAERPHDTPLHETGFQMARETALWLTDHKPQAIYCSPYLRTIQTAVTINESFALKIRIEHGLGEWLNPEWCEKYPEHITHDEALLQFGDNLDPNYKSVARTIYPETDEVCYDRCAKAIESILANSDDEDEIVLVTHGAAVMFMVRALLKDKEFKVFWPMCSINEMIWDGGKWTQGYVGHDHLSFKEGDN
ncbi:MAG: histidine phosphatase family protein [Lentisphaeria bacterium]|nr:histidine phosphatase family protein [Lentisphaeria bacterium]NQZ68887.1 histidine phosphatase family protein [Lentisphaeria bacterium]